ncbi:hypothetical protein BATDEDRAFT_89503 [Batrachochytrium dendrobatidis JAM81]|uniref:Group 1 truncated hemoglobin n=2 Tax=Batrachochytrium dendrobatidis TaxID=109871 RepID=F4P5H7_BATDJ|nr:uncharacterized protein BATDEDRAFT_89503 [Batrachochytrium dendrobatidis JAM81]EGF79192.1 hypothetical protein BATDEDRAFT_89503 [Batrachochytrium dendrobatidis JAM81]KAJ8322680.1 hypothetical protein O5D80_008222 [Batrachochytrium dendrobatidis]KAK5666063.1 hypothetical protein QVD99_007675 [Batrachochytrium dendrobatidis]OAJ42946.1 hypothetical protein BDEG_26335 [Batrachochytrium dendrobatidis JEL423]|eukprot:XP_006680049.1 hypothetical protein BATDEDRAFT_89503 [Batrachochytrium dendrobatidis JAM81]
MATLLDQVGGEDAVGAVVEIFYDNLVKDERVNSFFVNTNMARQRRMQKMFLLHVLGGREYNGSSMVKAHAKLNLKDEHFDAVIEVLTDALKTAGVADPLVKSIIDAAETTRDAVLGRVKEDA